MQDVLFRVSLVIFHDRGLELRREELDRATAAESVGKNLSNWKYLPSELGDSSGISSEAPPF